MDIFTTPAINLVAVGLFNMVAYKTDDTVETVTVIVPEFSLEKFFEEWESFNKEFNAYSDTDEMFAIYPTLAGTVFSAFEYGLLNVELVEIAWGISFEVGSPFPRYFKGYELV